MDELNDIADELLSGGSGGKSFLYKMILMSLCNNYNFYDDPQSEIDCQFKPQLKYDMMALRGHTIKITTVEKMPMSGTTLNEQGQLIGTGVAFTMLHEIQEQIGFKYEIIKPDVNEIGNATSGVIKQLIENQVDMAVMFFPMLKEYRKWISFSESLGEAEWVLMMKRPMASATGSGLLAPFEANVWIAILASLVAVGPIIYWLIVLRAKLCKGDTEMNILYPLGSCVWFVYGALMKQGSTLSPISDSARILFATWWIFITILTSFYTANLTAFLTLSQFTLTITKPEHIVSYKKYWLAEYGGRTYEMIENADELKDLKNTIPQYGRYERELASSAIYDATMRDVIFVGEKRKSIKLIHNDYLNKTDHKEPEASRCTYVLTGSFITKPVAFAYPRNGKLQKIMNPMLSYFVQGGIVDFLLNKPLPMTTICPLNLPSSERKLRNSDLKTTYYVVGVGFAVAALSFIIEFGYRFYKKRSENGGLSINSGDIASHFYGKTGTNFKTKFGDNYNNGKTNFGFINVQENRSPSTFLFQYTN